MKLKLYDSKLNADNDGWYKNSWYMINIQESNLPTHKKILTLIHNVEKETNRPATRTRNNRKKNYIKKENKKDKEVDEITSAKT